MHEFELEVCSGILPTPECHHLCLKQLRLHRVMEQGCQHTYHIIHPVEHMNVVSHINVPY